MNLDEMLTKYRDMKLELAPLLDNLVSLEKQIKSHVLETGETGDVDGIKVSIHNGYTRTSWDGKKLQGYAVAHPEVLAFSTETEVGPSVALSVK